MSDSRAAGHFPAEDALRIVNGGPTRKYVVCDPHAVADTDPVNSDGTLPWDDPRGFVGEEPPEWQTISGGVMLSFFCWWIAIGSSGVFWKIVGFPAALLFTAVTLMMIYFPMKGSSDVATLRARWAAARRRGTITLRVDRPTTRQWRLCQLAEAIIKTAAWKDREIDPHRKTHVLLWQVVWRCVELERQRALLDRATGRPELADLVSSKTPNLERGEAALQQFEDNLSRMKTAADAIDKRRNAERLRRVIEERHVAESQSLLAELGGASITLSNTAAENAADAVAGLAAETATVAELLRTSEDLVAST